jgi:hypothetical protein
VENVAHQAEMESVSRVIQVKRVKLDGTDSRDGIVLFQAQLDPRETQVKQESYPFLLSVRSSPATRLPSF